MSDRVFLPSRLGLLAASGLLALAACGPDGERAMAEDAEPASDPPGAALPLSIGNAGADEEVDAFAAAINCAAALELTSERLAQMSTGGVSREIDLIGRAKDYFADQAETAGANMVTSPAAAIARRKRDKAGETTQQAQLAIACLRRFGDELG
jgi:hypothetical protein